MIDENAIIRRMETLIDTLNTASEAYYGGDGTVIPDYDWNAKFDELEGLEHISGIVLPNSPTHNVSHSKLSGKKEQHEFPALSLPKSKDVKDVVRWADGKSVDLSCKLDGITLVISYDYGRLQKVVTRGDGIEGDNITHLAGAFYNIPRQISYAGRLVIRGEAVISYADFNRFNESCGHIYENPRNLAAGSCNPKISIDAIMDRGLAWIPFTLVYADKEIISWKERMSFLQSLGFETVASEYIKYAKNIPDKISEWSDKVDSMAYPVDGLVVVYDDTEYASHGSLTGHHDTRGGFAFKWQDEEAVTDLLGVEWSVSMNSINPVAIFKPVRLEGTTVQRASLCNLSECKRLGIGGEQTKLTVIKANKIIPKIVRANAVGEFKIPDKCPVCGEDTVIVTGKTGVEVLHCSNENCPAKNLSKMSRFVSKHGFDIKGISDRKLEELINKNLIKTPDDILTFTDRADDVKAVLYGAIGWGDRSVKNMLDAIETAKSVKPENFLYALCIPMCGRDVSRQLTTRYTILEIIKLSIAGDVPALSIDGVGDVKAESIVKWFQSEQNVAFVRNVYRHCSVIKNKKPASAGNKAFEGLTFVITGSLNNYKSRDALKEEIEKLGGRVVGAVSAKTSYLINNDIESTSSKNKKAKQLNVPIITEEKYINDLLKKERINHV
jgi:DNA ligase (NAD+)